MKHLKLSEEVRTAAGNSTPIVALESTIISHGMPYPDNVRTALQTQALIRELGAVPATIAVLDGKLRVGLNDDEIEHLGHAEHTAKISRRDLPSAVVRRHDGATTVAATMIAAHAAGIAVFATGGIGGVHRGASASFDVSADLHELASTPVLVVSAGAKAILDLSATLEYLETLGVPVVGYRTHEFPAFYSRTSGLGVPVRSDSAAEIAAMYEAQRALGFPQGMLVANPVPAECEIPAEEVNGHIDTAIAELELKGVTGPNVTPYLLSRIVELTGGKSLETNIKLYHNNVRLACEIARSLCKRTG